MVAIAAAGTGGHIYPGLAVAAELRSVGPQVEVVFLTTRRGLGAELLSRAGERVWLIDGQPAPFGISWRAAASGWAAMRGAVQARRRLREAGARVLLATGGYGSVPAVLASRSLGLPVVWHEQNVLPGRATRTVGRLAQVVAVGFPEARRHMPTRMLGRVRVTGNPVRREVLLTPRSEGARRLGLEPGKLTVLVVGASQGARRLNEAVVEAAAELASLEGVQTLVSTGAAHFEAVTAALARRCPPGRKEGDRWTWRGLTVVAYLADMPAALAACDLAVSRAGAISLAEFTARGIPMVLVPYPFAAEGHQQLNARVVQEAGAAVVVPDSRLTAATLLEVVRSLAGDRERLRAMAQASRRLGRPDAARQVAQVVLEVAEGGHRR